jgi:adenosylmethionine-8-amino-7-oxononanoate aminotransferase
MKTGLAVCIDMPGVADVRVTGAIGVVELDGKIDLDALRMQFVDAGVWIRPFGNVVYLMPALNIAHDDLDRLIAAIVGVVEKRGQTPF